MDDELFNVPELMELADLNLKLRRANFRAAMGCVGPLPLANAAAAGADNALAEFFLDVHEERELVDTLDTLHGSEVGCRGRFWWRVVRAWAATRAADG